MAEATQSASRFQNADRCGHGRLGNGDWGNFLIQFPAAAERLKQCYVCQNHVQLSIGVPILKLVHLTCRIEDVQEILNTVLITSRMKFQSPLTSPERPYPSVCLWREPRDIERLPCSLPQPRR